MIYEGVNLTKHVYLIERERAQTGEKLEKTEREIMKGAFKVGTCKTTVGS